MKVKKTNKTGQSFLAGAVIISLGGFISKILGAVYRIPLTNILGGEGMGIYQMVYPLYCILLTVSASGIPTGISRLISSGKGAGAERQAFRLYGDRDNRRAGYVSSIRPACRRSGGACYSSLLQAFVPIRFLCFNAFGGARVFSGQREYVPNGDNRGSGTGYKGGMRGCALLCVPR